MALTALWARGTLKFVVSQNCDGLHLRAGLPRRALAELHGDMFAERCAPCRRVYLRAFDTTERTARHHHATRRLCHACGAELADTIVHFGERGRAAWPLNWAGALRHAARADVVLCLGSSLKVLRRYPRLWRMQSAPHARPRLYIVNLQWTPKDAVAALKINARCDAVMRQVARRLRLRVPRYRAAADPLLAHAEPLAHAEAHTTRRPLLPPPSLASDSSSDSELPSPSASDSDEELPLRRLADRLRGGGTPHHNRKYGIDEGCGGLVAVQVEMAAGATTVLLRAEHARPDAPNGRERGSPFPLAPSSPNTPSPPKRDYSFESSDYKPEPKLERLDLKPEPKPGLFEAEAEPKLDVKSEEEGGSSGSEGAGSLAAAIIARAVLVCRGSLYPGLHTIIAGGGECAWCLRRLGAARCQWYGPPRLTPPEARAWRRVRARRYLCACCPRAAPAAPAEPAAPADRDTGGWYGKGYRKGRRRR